MIADIELNAFKQMQAVNDNFTIYTENVEEIVMYIITNSQLVFRYTYLKVGTEQDLIWKTSYLGKAMRVLNIEFKKTVVNIA